MKTKPLKSGIAPRAETTVGGGGTREARPDSKVSLCLGIQKKPETTVDRPLRGIREI